MNEFMSFSGEEKDFSQLEPVQERIINHGVNKIIIYMYYIFVTLRHGISVVVPKFSIMAN